MMEMVYEELWENDAFQELNDDDETWQEAMKLSDEFRETTTTTSLSSRASKRRTKIT